MRKTLAICFVISTLSASFPKASVNDQSFVYCSENRIGRSAIIGRFSKDGGKLEMSLAIWQGYSHLGIAGIGTITGSDPGGRTFKVKDGNCAITLHLSERRALQITPLQPSLCDEQGGKGIHVSEFTFSENDLMGSVTDEFDHDFDGNVQCKKSSLLYLENSFSSYKS